jgi:hypothetical protein
MHAAASTWHDGHFEPKAKATWKQKVAESKQAKKELVSAILASPISDIRGHFAKDLRKVHAVEDALQGRAFERR